MQRGRIYEASGSFFVQYRVTEMINGEPKRVQRSEFLCKKDSDLCYSKKAKEVTRLCREAMAKINAQQSKDNGRHATRQDIKVVDFYEQKFLPYSEEIIKTGERAGQPRKKLSTVRGYKQIWRQHLKAHFGETTLRQYEPRSGRQLLRGLTTSQNKNTLKHVKALATAIFGHAVEHEEIIDLNPWREIRIPDNAIEPKPTGHYTLKEAQALVSALVHLDCQLVLAFSCFLGIRPGEIAALRWEDFDFDAGTLHIQRSVVRGKVDVPKTQEANAEIPLIGPVLIPLKLWHDKLDKPETGYVFNSRKNTPIDLHNVVSRIIIPHVNGGRRCVLCDSTPTASGVMWKGLYSGRRGACAIAVEATNGNYAVAQALLRHRRMTTTLNIYKKQITQQAFAVGMKMLEAAAESAANGKK